MLVPADSVQLKKSAVYMNDDLQGLPFNPEVWMCRGRGGCGYNRRPGEYTFEFSSTLSSARRTY